MRSTDASPPAQTEAEALSALVMERLPDVAAHGERVSRYAQSVARELDVDSARWRDLEIAARFHDVGKLAMPEALIAKPSPLTRRRERRSCGGTSTWAPKSWSPPDARCPPRLAVRASHEWFQGGGYPIKTAGTAIPFVSRLIAVADAYDAMTQDRAYRLGWIPPTPWRRSCAAARRSSTRRSSMRSSPLPRSRHLDRRFRDELVPQPDTFAPRNQSFAIA